MKKIHITALAAISVILLLPSCKGTSKTAPETEQEEVLPDDIVELRQDQINMAGIQTGTVEKRSLNSTLKVSGTVCASPQSQASVCVPMGGFIKKSYLIPGNAVRKGQVLAVVENQDFVDIQQSYLEARNKLEFVAADYKRQSELYKNDITSQKNLQQITSEYKTLQAQKQAYQQKLQMIGINPARLTANNIRSSVNIVSPISGFVKTVNINLGKYVAPSDVLFEIVNSNDLFLELTLFDKDAANVSNGQPIHFFINNETEQHEAVIYQTGKAIGEDKTYKVYARICSQCKNLLPGIYVNALIESSAGKVPTLPSDAIISFDDKNYIFIVNKHKQEKGKPVTEYRMIEVEKGLSDNGYTQVILPPAIDLRTAQIVVKGAYTLMAAKKNAGEMSC